MGNLNVVDILNTGATGFSVIMLYLGYRLIADIQTKLFEQKPDAFSSIEMYREWKDALRSHITNTRLFFIVSIVFFAGGLLCLLYKPENIITLSVTPSLEESVLPLVQHQHKSVELDRGMAAIKVKDDQTIVISNERMIQKLNELDNKTQELDNRILRYEAEKGELASKARSRDVSAPTSATATEGGNDDFGI